VPTGDPLVSKGKKRYICNVRGFMRAGKFWLLFTALIFFTLPGAFASGIFAQKSSSGDTANVTAENTAAIDGTANAAATDESATDDAAADDASKKTGAAEGDTLRVHYFSAAGGMETSGQSPSGVSFNLVYLGDFRIHKSFSFGIKGGFYFASESVFSIEMMVFGRWYIFPAKTTGKWYEKMLDVFVQGSVGTDAFFRDNEPILSRALPVFDISAGARIPLPLNFYAEPFVRVGYPSLFGIGIMVGYRFPSFGKGEAKTERVIRTTNEIIRSIIITQVEYVIFGADSPVLNAGVDANARALNNKALEEVAKVLKNNLAFRVRIEGFANPVRNTEEEKQELQTLSLARATAIEAKLTELGVSGSQMVLSARGGTRAASVSTNTNLNRRVELMIVQIEE
jgi:outer membrane protein OmpA-like peptidoglycan-associated protein